jgi:hypothetical protein
MDQNAENAVAELLQSASAGAAVARLIYLKLPQRFPALSSYLAFLAVVNLGFGLLDQTSAIYFWCYIVLEPLKCVLSVLAVRELLSLAFDYYPGIRTVGRWAMYAGVAVALGISLTLTGFFWSGTATGRAHSRLFYLEVSQRSIVFSLAVVIVAILFFVSKYPLHLSRNTLVSSVFFSVLFLSEASRLLLDSFAPRLNIDYVDWTESGFIVICLIGWATLLRPEPRTARARIKFSRPQEDHLLQQLNSLNQLMTRSARR